MEMHATTVGQMSQGQFVDRLRAGDAAAYELLVELYEKRLLNTARRLVASEADAQDAVQDTFLAAFRSIDTFGGDAKLSTWLHRIVVNCCLMKRRARRRRPEELIEDVQPHFDDEGTRAETPSRWCTPVEEQVHDAEMRSIVRGCCERLPEPYRAVLMQRLVEGRDSHEVAVALGITANAVKIRLHRARQALGTLLQEALGDRGADGPWDRTTHELRESAA